MIEIAAADEGTKRLAHYIICNTEPSQLGATKLNKVMWEADVSHYRKFGRTISGLAAYQRMPQGPMPAGINDTLRALAAEGKIVERQVPTPFRARREFLWLEPCDPSQFSGDEVEAILLAIRAVCPLTAKEASDRTHDALWEELSNGDAMPVAAAAVQPAEIEPEEMAWVLAQARGSDGLHPAE